jgi:acyl-CoA synthetase (AMP-forming)/AMP-acid ligase II
MEELRNLPFSSIIGALEYQSEIRPEKIAILYPDPNANSTEYVSLTYKQYNNVLNHLAEKLSKYVPFNSSDESITCSLLAVGGIEYLLCEYALLKFPNVVMFPISARNSEAAVEHLLKETKTRLLLTTSQYLPMIKTIQQQEQFQSLKVLLLDNDGQFKIEELLKNKNVECSPTSLVNIARKRSEKELNKVVVILHR